MLFSVPIFIHYSLNILQKFNFLIEIRQLNKQFIQGLFKQQKQIVQFFFLYKVVFQNKNKI